MKLIALDFGKKRIGLAIGDSEIGIAAARDFLENSADVLEVITKLVKEENIKKILVGLPRGLRGETTQTVETRKFAKNLALKVTANVELVDERFTSKIAKRNLQAAGQNSRKQRSLIDSETARIMLQEYFDI